MRGELVRHTKWLLGVALALSMVLPARAADVPQVSKENIIETEEYLAAQLADEGRPGLSAAVVVGDEVYPIHLGERADGVSVTDETVFGISSLSKSVTALAVALLAESGRLSMDDPVTRYLPELGPTGHDLTVADLMHQRSGLTEYVGNEAWVGPLGESLDANVLRLESDLALDAPWQYSNANYDALALIVQRVSGQPFADYLDDNIFGPLGMTHTGIGTEGVTELSDGHYMSLVVGYVPVDVESSPGMAGSSAMLSTSEDLARFVSVQLHDGMLDGEQVIPSGAIEIVQEPRSYDIEFDEPPLVEPGYAGGLYVDGSFTPDVGEDLASLTTLWHRGDQLGFQSAMWMIPEADVGFVLLNNGNDDQNSDWTAHVAQGAKHVLFGLEPPDFYPTQEPLQRWGKQLLLTLVVAQVMLAFAVLPAIQRRRKGRKLKGFDWLWVISASVFDLVALAAIVWIIPEQAASPLRVVVRAPDYRILVVLMGAGVVWGALRTLLLVLGEPGPRSTHTPAVEASLPDTSEEE